MNSGPHPRPEPAAALPRVSIVTPCYNAARFLQETLQSVLSQDYPHIEYLVADGGSTDGTVALLEAQGGRLRYFSAPDRGPADAIAKGFAMASGEILAWLNADDVYFPGAIRAAAEYLAAHPAVDVVYGYGKWMDGEGAVIRPYPTAPFEARALERDCFICQPAAFFRASAYHRAGGLDPAIQLPFDYDLWIRMAKAGMRFDYLPLPLAGARMHRDALSLARRESVFLTAMDLLVRHYGYVPLSWVFGYVTFLADGRDQFFEPLRFSLRNYLAALPEGFRRNPTRRWRFLAEWLSAPRRGLLRRALGR